MVRTSRLALAVIAFALAVTGCSRPASAPVRLTGWIDAAQNLYADVPLTDDLPTYKESQPSPSYPGEPGLAMSQIKPQQRVDVQAVLSQIAASIDRTGKPDVPSDLPAAFAGKLEGDHYIYKLAGLPKEPDGELVYMLTKKPDGWDATPICRHSWAWVWPGTTQQSKEPVVICAYIEGSGANLDLAAYKAGREVLRFQGLSDSYIQVIPAPDGGAPTIVAYGGLQWLDHKAEPRVTERFEFTWQEDHYALTSRERRADWVYHVARLVAFAADGELERAAADFASPPPEGAQAYLDGQAPDLRKSASGHWTSVFAPGISERQPGRVYLRPAASGGGPWFAFAFNQDGLITTITEQADQPFPDVQASVPDQLLSRLKVLAPEQAVQIRDQWGIPDTAVYCAGTAEPAEEAVLACQWGKGYNAMQDGRALFWRDHGAWRTQPYPPEGVFRRGDFRTLRRDGDLLQVAMNVAKGETRMVEQVGLLQYDGNKWNAVWGPETASPYPELSIVFQPPDGIDWYTLFRDEGDIYIREDWVRRGTLYLTTNRGELSQEEYTATRFALALLRQVDIELPYWSTPQALGAAQTLDLAATLREGFTTQQGENGFVRVMPANGTDAWDLTVTPDGNLWKVTAVEKAQVAAFTEHLKAAKAVLGDLAKLYRSAPQNPEYQAGLTEIATKQAALDQIEARFHAGTTPISQLYNEVIVVMKGEL